MRSQQKCQILDPPYLKVTISHSFHYTPSPYVIKEIVTNIFLDQRPYKIMLDIFKNWNVTGTN